MGYMKIPNLYKDQDILLFKECYALEKIHGTSAHVSYKPGEDLVFFAGGVRPKDSFQVLFDREELRRNFDLYVGKPCVVFGEAYGGKMQKMAKYYGNELKFVVFDVRIGDTWLDVPSAENVVHKLGLEFVPYWRVQTDLDVLNKYRDLPSTQGKRNGVEYDAPGEGVVLRPLVEMIKSNGKRVIAKHKSEAFRETHSIRAINVDPAKREEMRAAAAIAKEWVVPMRLNHVLDKLLAETDADSFGMEDAGAVVKAVVNDVLIEAGDEIEDSKEVRKALGREAIKLFRSYLANSLRESQK